MRESELLLVCSPAVGTLYRTRTCESESPYTLIGGKDLQVAGIGRFAVCTGGTQCNKHEWSVPWEMLWIYMTRWIGRRKDGEGGKGRKEENKEEKRSKAKAEVSE